MFKKIFLSPFFAPIVFLVLWVAFMKGCFIYAHGHDVLALTEDGAIIDTVAKMGYVLLILVLLLFCNDFQDRLRAWGIYLFLAICCFLRESGIQHHLSQTDTTPFKSRFFINPNNSLSEKIIFGTVLAVVLVAILYLMIKYSKHLVVSFFKLDGITWSVATLCTFGVLGKIVDRYPSNYRKLHNGVPLPENVYTFLQIVEESSEMFLPYLAMLILWQFHLKISK
jgi:hypothetical protein